MGFAEAQAMLLAAGLGTRLWPLTSDRAKPAVPFLGRPLIAGVVELLAQHGIRRAVVNTHYQPASIHAALADARGVEVRYSHEAEILGTAGGLAKGLAEGLLSPDLPTLIVNAKLYTDLDLAAVLRTHRATGAKVTMALRTNAAREAFREVLVTGDRVTGFGIGRTPDPRSERPLLFTGVHVISPEVLRGIRPGYSDTVADVYPPLIAAGEVAAHVDDAGRWWELSTLERYLGLHRQAAEEGLGPDVVLSPGASVAPGAQVRRAILWEGASVPAGADLEDVVLAAGVTLPAGARLRRVVVVRRDRAGPIERGTVEGELIHVPV